VASSGRFADAHGNALYMVSPDLFAVMSISGADAYPDVVLFEQ